MRTVAVCHSLLSATAVCPLSPPLFFSELSSRKQYVCAIIVLLSANVFESLEPPYGLFRPPGPTVSLTCIVYFFFFLFFFKSSGGWVLFTVCCIRTPIYFCTILPSISKHQVAKQPYTSSLRKARYMQSHVHTRRTSLSLLCVQV